MHQPDPIVEEARAARAAIARQYQYDFHKVVEALRAKDEADSQRVVSLPPRRVQKAG